MKKTYNSFLEIENDLKRLDLERQIHVEEIKIVNKNFNKDLEAYQWVSKIFGQAKKYGLVYLIKRFLLDRMK